MSTAGDLITMALKDIQVLDESETPSAYLMADALTTLNQMMSQWAIDGLYVNAQTELTFTPTGAASYTIGPSGTINTTTPNTIDYAFLRQGNVDFPVCILTSFDQYQSIGYKDVKTFPEYLYYNQSYPLGTIYLYPKPQATDGVMHIVISTAFPVYSSSASNISMPPQYDMAIRFSLAEILAAMMGRNPTEVISAIAKRSRTMIKRDNSRITTLDGNDVVTPSFARITRGY